MKNEEKELLEYYIIEFAKGALYFLAIFLFIFMIDAIFVVNGF